MSKNRIPLAVIAAAVKRVCAAAPTRVDRRPKDGLPPRYMVDGVPVCLVAKVLHELGFTAGQIHALDREFAPGELVHAGVRIEESRHPALRRLDPLGVQLLAYVQRGQDRRWSWGEVARAALTVPRLRVWATWAHRGKPWLKALSEPQKP